MGDERDLIDELRERAGADGDTFSIGQNGVRFTVDYKGGSSSSLSFVARYDDVARADHEAIALADKAGAYRRSARATSLLGVRPMEITLRPETAGDQAAKREGINIEHQTGDPIFDRQVYVSTPTTDEALLRAVLGPKVREGVLALLVLGFKHVQIDHEGRVKAYLLDFTQRTPRPGRGARAVDAFFLVLSDLPRVEASGAAHPKIPAWASDGVIGVGILAALVVVIPAWASIADANHCSVASFVEPSAPVYRDRCVAPTALALFAGLGAAAIASALAGRFAKPRLRGGSDSAEQILFVRGAVFTVVLVATFLAASAIGLALVPR